MNNAIKRKNTAHKVIKKGRRNGSGLVGGFSAIKKVLRFRLEKCSSSGMDIMNPKRRNKDVLAVSCPEAHGIVHVVKWHYEHRNMVDGNKTVVFK